MPVTATADVVEQAIAQVELGFAAFALARNGKTPVTEHGFKNATRNPDWVRTQLEAPSAGNYGMTWPVEVDERVVAFDLDNGSEGLERPWQDRLVELMERIGPLPPTKSTTTPSGGRHAFYRWPANVPIPAGDELFGFTVRWPGRGYLVGPGSSIDGVAYLPGPTSEIADLPPEWVAAAVEDRRGQRGRDEFIVVGGTRFEVPDVIPAGRRYAAVRDFVASRYNDGLPVDELWELVKAKVAPHFSQPKTDAELRADFERVIAKIEDRLGPPRRSPAAATIPTGPLEDAPLTEFTSTPIEWLWPSWLPKGVVTLMDGNPGVSKSTVVADLVARITTGRPWPDGEPPAGGPGRVMWVTTEDDPGRVLRPRVEAAGGDASLVRFVVSEVVFPSGAGAFRELVVQRAAEPEGLAMVVLDPLFSHIEASVRTIADAEMRKGVMNPLAETAEVAGVAILVVRHFNKDSAASALNRGAGSLGGIVGAARALWSVTLDPEDETGETKVVGVAKLNYARPRPPLRYMVVDRIPPGWVVGSVSGIEWIGEAPVSITAMMEETAAVADAVPTLREILSRGAIPAAQANAQMKARGFGRDATRGAARRLHVERSKAGFIGGWLWSLPAELTSEPTSQPTGVSSADVRSVSSRMADIIDVDFGSQPPSQLGEESELTGGVSSSGGSKPRARARAGGNRLPDSSDSSGDSGVVGAQPPEPPDPTGPSRARPRARGTGEWVEPCRDYANHRSSHRRTEAGWVCDICTPEATA